MAEAILRDCETQKNEIAELLKTTLKKGDTWYLVDAKWFKQWKKYVGFDTWDAGCVGDETVFPGPIDNSPLCKEGTKNILKEHLIDELDYILVPEEGWKKLVSWYNMVDTEVELSRKVIEQGTFVKHCKVEVYLMELKLCHNRDLEHVVTEQFSKADTIECIEKKMQQAFNISDNTEVRLWNKYLSNTYEHLSRNDVTIQDAGLYQGTVIVIEEKNADGTWSRQTSASSAYSSPGVSANSMNKVNGSPAKTQSSPHYSYYTGGSSSYYSYEGRRSSSMPGLCGLGNLGNTCFMNSALQCLSNVSTLTEYFMADQWRDELNCDNPLGMHGEIASSYAELVKVMWSGRCSYTVPRNFKVAVGRFAPQFSGYQQQDSQELMAFVLDGLHEDLNRIHKKPYIELKDADGRPDEDVAKEAWENYLKRNDSIIVDIFHGLLKSTLVCPECNKVSVTFDPFCYLSLPLPMKKERFIDVCFVPLDPSKKPRKYKLAVPKQGTAADLCIKLAEVTGISDEKLLVTDVYNHRFHKLFTPEDGLNNIIDKDDIYVYELPVTSLLDEVTRILPVYLQEQKPKQKYSSNYQHTNLLFGVPLLVPIPRKNCTYDTLYKCVLTQMSRYVKLPDDNEEWWNVSGKDGDSVNDCASQMSNGEVAMDGEQDETDEGRKEKGTGASMEDENSNEGCTVSPKCDPRLLSFSIVNSLGNSMVDSIRDDGRPITLSNSSYVAAEWHPVAKTKFYDEMLALDVDVDDSVNRNVLQRKNVIQLTNCLEMFTSKEQLGRQDPWYCPRCKKHQQASKKFDLWQLPEVLVIHLKRFSYNRNWRDKLDVTIEFPTRGLDMQKYIIKPDHGPSVYDLIAVSNHYGGLGGGHYTAYAQNKEDGQWYHFDDSNVSSTSEDAVVTRAGYVLVYQRRKPNYRLRQQDDGNDDKLQLTSHTATASATIGSPERNMRINSDTGSDNGMDTN